MSESVKRSDQLGVTTLTLNRPGRHNAFDDELLRQLHHHILDCREQEQVRVVVLAAEGKSFCAGADLNWMRRMVGFSAEENYLDAMAMADFYHDLATLPKPTVAAVQGAAIGGGAGLVAACDIVLAVGEAVFGLAEVKIGLMPAVISPYIKRAVGFRQAQRLALTGERIDAEEAARLGLVHRVVAKGELGVKVDMVCRELLANGPEAMAAVKNKLFAIDAEAAAEEKRLTARYIAEMRVSAEGREGVGAFLEKRKPDWAP